MATALKTTRAGSGSELRNTGQGWELRLATQRGGQDGRWGGGGLEGSVPGMVTPSRAEGTPGP